MSRSKHERGDFIREKMGLYILRDLGDKKISAEEAGGIDDLMRNLLASGVTYHAELATHKYYLTALEEWKKYLKAQKERRKKKGV